MTRRKPFSALAVVLAALLCCFAATASAKSAKFYVPKHHRTPQVALVRYIIRTAPYCGAGPCRAVEVMAPCPAGMFVVGGSASASTARSPVQTFVAPSFYLAVADNESGNAGAVRVTAICSSAVAPGSGRDIAILDEFAADAAQRTLNALEASLGERVGGAVQADGRRPRHGGVGVDAARDR